jgi:hypothetical protein
MLNRDADRPKPADPLRGRYTRCSRCRGTGQARYNHLNGDTHCYLCGGGGWRVTYSAAEKAQIEAEAAWYGKAYADGYQLGITVRRLARQVGADRARARRTATFWVKEGLEAMGE